MPPINCNCIQCSKMRGMFCVHYQPINSMINFFVIDQSCPAGQDQFICQRSIIYQTWPACRRLYCCQLNLWRTAKHSSAVTPVHLQTLQKLLGFHQTEDRFWPDFADIKHDYTQECYRSYSSFISQGPRTGKFRGVCICNGVTTVSH